MTDTGVTTYFDQDYRGGAIGAVFIWFFMTIQPGVISLIVQPYRACTKLNGGGKDCTSPGDASFNWNLFTKAHKHAVAVLNIGATMIFGLLFLFSLFSWIQTDNRIMQKVYYRFIAWLIPLSWVLAVWVMTAAIWSASTKTEWQKVY